MFYKTIYLIFVTCEIRSTTLGNIFCIFCLFVCNRKSHPNMLNLYQVFDVNTKYIFNNHILCHNFTQFNIYLNSWQGWTYYNDPFFIGQTKNISHLNDTSCVLSLNLIINFTKKVMIFFPIQNNKQRKLQQKILYHGTLGGWFIFNGSK